MKCKGIRQREKERRTIARVTSAIAELNPLFIFVKRDDYICSSCETSEELLELNLPEWMAISNICAGRLDVVTTGGKSFSINANCIE